jgi:hypothetical protein
MSIDRELESAAREMIAAAEEGRSVLTALRAQFPQVLRQIQNDAYSHLFSLIEPPTVSNATDG